MPRKLVTYFNLVVCLAAKMRLFYCRYVKKNSTKLMNSLGGIGLYDVGEVEWLFRPISMV